MATVKLSAKSVGSVVKIRVNNTAREFIVVHQGKPSSIYDDSFLNGTIVLMKDIYETRQWHSSNVNDYANSAIHSYLNSTFLNLFDSNVKSAIKQVKVPYRPGSGTGTNASSGASGLSAKIFLLSQYEAGGSIASTWASDGAKLDYFISGGGTEANKKRYAYLNGTRTAWWLRSPATNATSQGYSRYVTNSGTSIGSIGNNACSNSHGIRPALVLPSSLSVTDDGTLITNTAPTAPSSMSLPSTVRSGVYFTVSWSSSTDSDGNLQGYYVYRSLDGGSWSQIYQGGSTSTTDYISYGAASSVQYRVYAYDTQGASSGYTYSSTKTIVHNLAPSSPGSITVPVTVNGGSELTVSWGAASDSDGNLSGYQLYRQYDGGSWTQLYSGASRSYTDNITKGWTSVAYRVRAYDSYNAYSGYTTSATRTVNNNTAPSITCGASDLGDVTEPFSFDYTVADADGDELSVTEALDSTARRTFTAAPDNTNTFSLDDGEFMRVLNGTHTVTVTATDSNAASTALSVTFNKAVHELSITLANPLPADALITKCVLSIAREIPADAAFTVEVTNNALDNEPAWEDATDNVILGLNYLFENTAAANGSAFNLRIRARRGSSGVGGYIGTIGGGFE